MLNYGFRLDSCWQNPAGSRESIQLLQVRMQFCWSDDLNWFDIFQVSLSRHSFTQSSSAARIQVHCLQVVWSSTCSSDFARHECNNLRDNQRTKPNDKQTNHNLNLKAIFCSGRSWEKCWFTMSPATVATTNPLKAERANLRFKTSATESEGCLFLHLYTFVGICSYRSESYLDQATRKLFVRLCWWHLYIQANLSVEIESQTAMGENHTGNTNAVTSALIFQVGAFQLALILGWLQFVDIQKCLCMLQCWLDESHGQSEHLKTAARQALKRRFSRSTAESPGGANRRTGACRFHRRFPEHSKGWEWMGMDGNGWDD